MSSACSTSSSTNGVIACLVPLEEVLFSFDTMIRGYAKGCGRVVLTTWYC